MRRILWLVVPIVVLYLPPGESTADDLKTIKGKVTAVDFADKTITVGKTVIHAPKTEFGAELVMRKLLDTGRPAEVEVGDSVTITYTKEADGGLLLHSLTNHSHGGKASPQGKTTTSGKEAKAAGSPAVASVGATVNDYLVYAISAFNQSGRPESISTLKATAEPIARRHRLPWPPVVDNPVVHFPRELCMGVFDQNTGLLVPEFRDQWVDLMKLATIRDRGDFPEILLKGFRVSLAPAGDKYRIEFPEGAKAQVGGRVYGYSATAAKWAEEGP